MDVVQVVDFSAALELLSQISIGIIWVFAVELFLAGLVIAQIFAQGMEGTK